ncbi:hypothetical protein [Candidatus Entotheonella palauensis]|uniref:hypothetical protein n=1 Tax=Candidatus Entotheonella palauensis TaxID=93172 RepID=UPI0015C422AB|nr:hypothetical protein [Candidatus Entotheonella palauensis]
MAEPFLTTVVGSMPKPAWLFKPSVFHSETKDHHGRGSDWGFEGDLLRDAQDDATRAVIHTQERVGIDIVSDGEMRRKSYLTYITMRLEGFDYETLAEKWIRDGRRLAHVGRCVGSVHRTAPIVLDHLQFLLAEARTPVKITLPGPMTVVDSTFDLHYQDECALAMDVAAAMNAEARELDALGPAVIQFDEPVFSRYPEKVAAWGIDALDRCVEGLTAKTSVHVCYSYPSPNLERPIKPSYPAILKALDRSQVDQLALEFEAPQLDPSLLQNCPSKTVLFGCIDNGTEVVETPEAVANRLLAAAAYLPPAQIQVAPDCGLMPLSRAAAEAKLAAMIEGARIARKRL